MEEALETFWGGKRVRKPIVEFASDLVRGTVGRQEEIDGVLATVAHNWRVSRMAVVDRNVLRLALHEMLYGEATPPVVIINEAIEIAKKFGNDDSGPFINGILDAIRLAIDRGEIERPPDEPSSGPGRVRNSA